VEGEIHMTTAAVAEEIATTTGSCCSRLSLPDCVFLSPHG